MLAGVAAPVYRIGPAGVFEEPLTVRLAIAPDLDPQNADIYYYSEDPDQEGWYRGERVMGWKLPGSVQVIEEDGIVYLEFEVNHSGVVQLGRDVSPKLGGMGVSATGGATQRLALFALLFTALLLGAWVHGNHRGRSRQ